MEKRLQNFIHGKKNIIMNLGLKDKVFIVTGGAKGIGGGISQTLAKEGAKVVIADRMESDNMDIVKKISEEGGISKGITAELTEEDACKKVVELALENFGRIDGLVNNAGVNDGIGLEKGSPEDFLGSIKRNLLHYYAMAHFALPSLKETRGAIVNIGSVVSLRGQGSNSGYAASKGGINGLTREWANELLSYSIRVNAVLPGHVWTPLYDYWINKLPDPEEKLKKITSRIPFERRFTTIEEIANTVVFLLSGMSGHTTGQILVVDGGYTHLDVLPE